MKVKPSKYHLVLSGNDSSKITVGNETNSSSKCEKLLGVKIDSHLNFKEHIESLCKKASQKINALPRLASSMSFEQRRLIMNSFVIFHFSYCPVVWIFHSRKLNAPDFMKGSYEKYTKILPHPLNNYKGETAVQPFIYIKDIFKVKSPRIDVRCF